MRLLETYERDAGEALDIAMFIDLKLRFLKPHTSTLDLTPEIEKIEPED